MARTVVVTWRNNNKELFECDSFRVEGNFIYMYLDPEIDGGDKKLRTIITSDLVKSITAVPEEKKVKVKKVKKTKRVKRVKKVKKG